MAMLYLPPPSQCRRSFSLSVFNHISGETSLSSRLSLKTYGVEKWVSRFRSKSLSLVFSRALALGLSLSGVGFAEAKVGVNKPELLPKEFTSVIDVAGFLSNGQEKRIAQEIADLEKDTGFKLRVLAQNYPVTPGLAIKNFWQVDDNTIVFVADPTFGSIPNLIVKFLKYTMGSWWLITGF